MSGLSHVSIDLCTVVVFSEFCLISHGKVAVNGTCFTVVTDPVPLLHNVQETFESIIYFNKTFSYLGQTTRRLCMPMLLCQQELPSGE